MSSWEPPAKDAGGNGDTSVPDNRWPQDVHVKKGYTFTQQLGIAVAALVDDGKMALIEWVKQVCLLLLLSEREILILYHR